MSSMRTKPASTASMMPSLVLPPAAVPGWLDLWILWMAKWFLAVDMLTGGLLLGGLSAAYKLCLLFLMCVALCFSYSRAVVLLPLSLLLLLLGPTYSLLQYGHMAGFSYDVGMALKLLSLLVGVLYFAELSQRAPVTARQALFNIMLFTAVLFAINMAMGALGFGATAYQPNEFIPNAALGTKGFFKAANEASALLLLLSGYWLAWSFPRSKPLYVLFAVSFFGMGALMLTKTGMLGVLLLTLAIPLLQSRRVWGPYRRVTLASLVLLLIGALLVLWLLPTLLSTLGVGQKLLFTYQQQGLVGILLSSRDQFAIENWRLVSLHFADWHRLFGVGVAALGSITDKYLAEIDPFDLLLWFGMAGIGFYLLWFTAILRFALHYWRRQPTSTAAGLFASSAVLLLVATMAGHVLTSGMLWICWSAWIGMLATEVGGCSLQASLTRSQSHVAE